MNYTQLSEEERHRIGAQVLFCKNGDQDWGC
jgi:hypothetical protein